jgi:hypothetical protein
LPCGFLITTARPLAGKTEVFSGKNFNIANSWKVVLLTSWQFTYHEAFGREKWSFLRENINFINI